MELSDLAQKYSEQFTRTQSPSDFMMTMALINGLYTVEIVRLSSREARP